MPAIQLETTRVSETKITTDQLGHVLLIGFNRAAKRNAFDLEMHAQLAAAYGRLERDPELRCGLIYAHGDHFTGGIDLAQWGPVMAQGKFPEIAAGSCDPFGLDPARRVGKPLVAAAHGICFTIGIELMLATDVRVAAAGTRFGQIEVRRGIYAIGGATLRMVQEFGWANAQRYLLTGDEFDAEEALRIGLVQEIAASREAAFERALSIAQTIARQAPLAVYASLKSSRMAVMQAEQAAATRLLELQKPLFETEDAKEGVQSFLERREGKFKGR
jgi:enoyl-CoA hydratase/carnithine racemase